MKASSPILRKLLLGSLLLILSAVVALDLLVSRYIAERETHNVGLRLNAEAAILKGEVESLGLANVAAWTRTAGVRASCRVTLIDRSGRVLADSEHDVGTMENHARRPEVASAIQGSQGVAVRRSATLERDLLYLAAPASLSGGVPVVLRLAVPLEQVDTAIAEVRNRILRVSLIAALIALAVAYIASRSLSRRIAQVKAFAEGLANDRPPAALPPGPEDELGELARSLNRMAAQSREMLEQLQLESNRRETILAGMVEGVLAVDHELCVTFCNQAFARAIGVVHPVPDRIPVLELVRDPVFLDMLTTVLVTGDTRRRRLALAAAEGHTFEVQAAPLGLRSGRGALAILHDVTHLERLERIRSDFVANVSHELRTPLASIQGYAETLLDGGLEDRENNRRFVEIIKAHSLRLNSIASDLLSLSELESAQADPPREAVPLDEALEAAIRVVESEAALRKVRIHSGDPGGVIVSAHRNRLEQVLVNLLLNAVKFNHPEGEVWVSADREDDGTVKISVADNGIGIPSEDVPRIFERFYRVDKARSRQVGGTGLGLSIVKHAVERMGGTVSVESQLGKGSKFTVTLRTL